MTDVKGPQDSCTLRAQLAFEIDSWHDMRSEPMRLLHMKMARQCRRFSGRLCKRRHHIMRCSAHQWKSDQNIDKCSLMSRFLQATDGSMKLDHFFVISE